MAFYKTFAAACLAVAAGPALAIPVLIDDFSTNGFVQSNSGGNPATGVFGGAADTSILGGERFMWVSTDTEPSPNSGTSFEVATDALAFANGTNRTGQAVLVYDGVGTGVSTETFAFDSVPATLVPSATFPTGTSAEIPVNTSGLGGVDFLQGFTAGERSFEFGVQSFDDDGQLDFNVYVWDMDGRLATYEELLINPSSTVGIDFDTILPLLDFDVEVGFEWDNIGALAFSVESLTEEFDGALTSISVVPLPLSSLLLLGGLGGLFGASAVSKRRRKA